MEKKTEKVIKHIRKIKTKEELFEYLEKEHLEVKNYLLRKGKKFFDNNSQFSQYIIGEQHFHGKEEVEMLKTYEELNYIRILLNGKIIQDADEQERFNPIKQETKEIIRKLNLFKV